MFDNLRNMLNFDDLLFEKRNKDYGAYQLRKRYNSVVFFSIIVAALLFSGGIIMPFLSRPKNERVLSGGYGYATVTLEHFEPPQDEIYIPPAPPPPPLEKSREIVEYVPPVVVDTMVPEPELLPTADELENIPSNEDTANTGSGLGDNIFGVDGGDASGNPYFIVETMPSFRGGDISKFREWVLKHTNYPQQAIEKKIRGKVYLTFIVETDGSISSVTVVQGVDPIIDVEAVHAIEASPKWTPGQQRGRPVRVRYSIMLNFIF
jgi:protein TonB